LTQAQSVSYNGGMRTKLLTFGARLRQLRESRGLTQSELAARAGLTDQWVSHFEIGRREPTFRNLQALAQGLGVGLSAFDGCLAKQRG